MFIIQKERRRFVMLHADAWQILILPTGRELMKESQTALKQCVEHAKCEFRLQVFFSRLFYGFQKEAKC